MKVCIASSRPIGERCRDWAARNLPEGVTLTDDPESSEVFISVLYGHLVSETFISPRRCYNFHPGILPQYRGAGAFSWCLLNGDKECGITLHKLEVDIDSGPVIALRTFPVHPWDTAESLFGKGMGAIYELFTGWFARLVAGLYTAEPQDESKAKLYYRRDLERQRDLTRFARAFAFEGKPGAFYTDRHGRRHELRW